MRFTGQFDDEPRAIAESVAAFCSDALSVSDRAGPGVDFTDDVWKSSANLGVLGLGTPEGGGGSVEIVAVMEELGRAGIAAPFAETFVVQQLLPPNSREVISAGGVIPTVVVRGEAFVRWGEQADLFVEFDESMNAWVAQPTSARVALQTVGVIPWATVELSRVERLGPALEASAVGDVALASYLAGVASAALASTVAHVRQREQFGRPIGQFQAVSHPLAECQARVTAARDLARMAAFVLDGDEPDQGSRLAAMAVETGASAALQTIYACQQAYGGMGYVTDGPLGSLPFLTRDLCVSPRGFSPPQSFLASLNMEEQEHS